MKVSDLEQALMTRWHFTPVEARRLAHLSSGRPGYALYLHENTSVLEKRKDWITDLMQILNSNRRKRFMYAERLQKDKDTFRQVLQVWLSFWRDLLICSAGSSAPLINLDWENDLRTLANRLDLADIRTCASGIEQTLLRLDANVNPRLLAEVMLLDWPGTR
jgi:DNA polymerase III subunit delta'